MLINSPFEYVNKSKIFVPPWIRIPLALTSGQDAFLTIVEDNPLHLPEILVTPFSDLQWKDLWRLEVDLIDQPGLLRDISIFLEEKGCFILASEGTTIDGGSYSTASFFFDASGYKSSHDRSTLDRARSEDVDLHEMYCSFVARFIRVLRFLPSREPRVRLRRVLSYFRLSKMLSENLILKPVKSKIKDGFLRVPPEIMRKMRSHDTIKNNRLKATCAADTKDRIVRLLLATEKSCVQHVRIFFDYSPNSLSKILSCISRGQFDIFRYQLRHGLVRPNASTNIRLVDACATLDLLLFDRSFGSISTRVDIAGIVKNRLSLDKSLTSHRIFVCSGSSGGVGA